MRKINRIVHNLLLVVLIKRVSLADVIDCREEVEKNNGASSLHVSCGSSNSDKINVTYCDDTQYLMMYPMDMDFIDKCRYEYKQNLDKAVTFEHVLVDINGKKCLPEPMSKYQNLKNQIFPIMQLEIQPIQSCLTELGELFQTGLYWLVMAVFEERLSMKIWVQKNIPVTLNDEIYVIDCLYNKASEMSTFTLRTLTVREIYLESHQEEEVGSEVVLGGARLQTLEDQRLSNQQMKQNITKILYETVKGQLVVKSKGRVIGTMYRNSPLRLELSFLSFRDKVSILVKKCSALETHSSSNITIIKNGCGIKDHVGDEFVIEARHPEYLVTPEFLLNPDIISSDQIQVVCWVVICEEGNPCENKCDDHARKSTKFDKELMLQSQIMKYLPFDEEQEISKVYIKKHEWRLELPYYIVIVVLFIILVILIIMIAVLTIKVLHQQPGNRSGAQNASTATPIERPSIKKVTPSQSGADSGFHVSFVRELPGEQENLPPFPAFDDFESPPETVLKKSNEADAGPSSEVPRGRSASLADFDSDIQSALGALRASSRSDPPDSEGGRESEGYRDSSTITFIGNRRPDTQPPKTTRL